MNSVSNDFPLYFQSFPLFLAAPVNLANEAKQKFCGGAQDISHSLPAQMPRQIADRATCGHGDTRKGTPTHNSYGSPRNERPEAVLTPSSPATVETKTYCIRELKKNKSSLALTLKPSAFLVSSPVTPSCKTIVGRRKVGRGDSFCSL